VTRLTAISNTIRGPQLETETVGACHVSVVLENLTAESVVKYICNFQEICYLAKTGLRDQHAPVHCHQRSGSWTGQGVETILQNPAEEDTFSLESTIFLIICLF